MNSKKLICILLVLVMATGSFPASAFADDPAPTMDPKQTNELYDGLIDGFKKADLSDELKGVEFDNSLLWGVNDWSRAWLIISLCSDLKDNDQVLYDRYAAKASKFYMALIPPMFNKDDPYSYQILMLDDTNALSFHYTPGSKYCAYSEYSNIGQENIENLSILAPLVWEVTEDDFNTLNGVIENGTAAMTGKSNTPSSTPKPTPTPTPEPSKEPLPDWFDEAAARELAPYAIYNELTTNSAFSSYDIDSARYSISSVSTGKGYYSVTGTIQITQKHMSLYTQNGTFSVFIPFDDIEGTRCTIFLNK